MIPCMERLLKKNTAAVTFVVIMSLATSGCLTAERKEITFWVKPDGSGSGRILFRDIVSVPEDTNDASVTDYTELVDNYLKGRKFEEYYPQYTNFKKRLFEQNGKLNGEVTFDFGHYEDVGLYRYLDRGPWMYHVGMQSEFGVERYDTSNGSMGGQMMPVVFWPENTTEFRISSRFERSDLSIRPLLPLFKRIGTD